MPELLVNGPALSPRCLILAHGAGAAMDTPFMQFFAEGLAARGILCVRFEFPYMTRRRQTGEKRPPDREPVLLETWRAVVADVQQRFSPETLVIGGKSMGGRMASLIAEDVKAAGLVGLGFPFYAAGKAGWTENRLGHLRSLPVPTLICQGERDPMGSRKEVTAMPLPEAIRLLWLPDGDHSLKPRKSSGIAEADNLAASLDAIVAFVSGLERR